MRRKKYRTNPHTASLGTIHWRWRREVTFFLSVTLGKCYARKKEYLTSAVQTTIFTSHWYTGMLKFPIQIPTLSNPPKSVTVGPRSVTKCYARGLYEGLGEPFENPFERDRSAASRQKKRRKSEVTAKEERRHGSLLMTQLGVQLWPPSRTFRKPFERDGSAASRQNNCCHEVEKCATTRRKQLLPRVVAKTASGRKQKTPP